MIFNNDDEDAIQPMFDKIIESIRKKCYEAVLNCFASIVRKHPDCIVVGAELVSDEADALNGLPRVIVKVKLKGNKDADGFFIARGRVRLSPALDGTYNVISELI